MVPRGTDMSTIRALALAHGRAKKRNNAVAAALCGLIPAILLARHIPTTWERCLLGVIIGLVWANGFEYVYHRWLLHWPQSSFGQGHLMHHMTVGAAQEAEHATFGESPIYVVLLFAINGVLGLAVDLLFRVWISPGLFVGWAIYMIAVEEIHWRIHLEEWLPPGLEAARTYHLAHHDISDGRYNVFFPLFDFVFQNINPPMEEIRLPVVSAGYLPARPAAEPGVAMRALEFCFMTWALLLALHYHFLTGGHK